MRCGVKVNQAGHRCGQHCCIERDCFNPRDGEGVYCARHACASDDCYDRRGASGRYCEYHKAEYQQETAVVTHTRLPRGVTHSRPTQNDIHEYGTAFLDGYQLGLNVQPGEREYAQMGMGQWGIDSGHDGERAQRRQGMAGVAGLVTQMQMQGDDVAALWGQPRMIAEVEQQQTLGDLISGVNGLDLSQDNREDHIASDRIVEFS